jgi:hypothetical protein
MFNGILHKFATSDVALPFAFVLSLLQARAPCAYVYLDVADVTSMKGALAVAVAGKTKGADPKGTVSETLTQGESRC